MIRIFVGRSDSFRHGRYSMTYRFPERGLHPRDQIAFVHWLVDKYLTKRQNYLVETYSDFILKALNNEIIEGRLQPGDVEAYDEGCSPAISDKVEEYGYGYPSIDEEIEYVERNSPITEDPWL